jgi:hypothetical protein
MEGLPPALIQHQKKLLGPSRDPRQLRGTGNVCIAANYLLAAMRADKAFRKRPASQQELDRFAKGPAGRARGLPRPKGANSVAHQRMLQEQAAMIQGNQAPARAHRNQV